MSSIQQAMTHMTPTLANIFTNDWWHKLWFRADGATSLAKTTDETGMWLWWFCTLWFVFLMALMFYFVVKYRRRKGQIAPKSPSHNTPLEIAWTVIPTLFLVWIFFKGFWTYMDKVMAPGDAVTLDLTASKWNWDIVYPNGSRSSATTVIGARSIPVFYMPADRPIQLRMQSSDVMHSFFVPAFRTKQDIFPNRYTTTWFKANAPSGKDTHPTSVADYDSRVNSAKSKGGMYSGAAYIKELEGVPYEDHWLFCAEYCGAEHSEMAAIVRIVPEDAFNKWLDTIGTGSLPPLELGKRLFTIQGCGQCHTTDGRPSTGPTWKNLYGYPVTFSDGTSMTAEQRTDMATFSNYIRESVLTPAVKIVSPYPNQMTPYAGKLNDRDIQALIAYIVSLSDKAPAEGAAPAAEGQPASGQPALSTPPANQPAGNLPANTTPAPKQ
ncbi:MAG TPA: cytochrome c oxidase subunit II [Phycisphaerales bacterium]|nr:cytochrome c oxidase subunit II [Phycisphaerales bacterium]